MPRKPSPKTEEETQQPQQAETQAPASFTVDQIPEIRIEDETYIYQLAPSFVRGDYKLRIIGVKE